MVKATITNKTKLNQIKNSIHALVTYSRAAYNWSLKRLCTRFGEYKVVQFLLVEEDRNQEDYNFFGNFIP
jgi:hypothetical protein